jgi:hypothetical protein
MQMVIGPRIMRSILRSSHEYNASDLLLHSTKVFCAHDSSTYERYVIGKSKIKGAIGAQMFMFVRKAGVLLGVEDDDDPDQNTSYEPQLKISRVGSCKICLMLGSALAIEDGMSLSKVRKPS